MTPVRCFMCWSNCTDHIMMFSVHQMRAWPGCLRACLVGSQGKTCAYHHNADPDPFNKFNGLGRDGPLCYVKILAVNGPFSGRYTGRYGCGWSFIGCCCVISPPILAV